MVTRESRQGRQGEKRTKGVKPVDLGSMSLIEYENAEQLREQLSVITAQLQQLNETMNVIANALTGGSPPPSTNGHVPEPD